MAACSWQRIFRAVYDLRELCSLEATTPVDSGRSIKEAFYSGGTIWVVLQSETSRIGTHNIYADPVSHLPR
jgi:hypothetical protein